MEGNEPLVFGFEQSFLRRMGDNKIGEWLPTGEVHMPLINYEGYELEVECAGSDWWVAARPRTPDLPILQRRKSGPYRSSAEAMSEAKQQINRLRRL